MMGQRGRIAIVAFIAGATAFCAPALAQSAIQLEPFPSTSYAPKSEVHVTTVHNYYGQCGTSVIQVLGVERQVDDFFVVDGPSAAIIVLAPGGRRRLDLKDALSDHNGVACVTKGPTKFLLVWSNCGGTACGDDFNFTVVDVNGLRMIAGGNKTCDERCAYRITGSRLPLKLNRQ